MHGRSGRVLLHVNDHVLDELAARGDLFLDLLALMVLLSMLHGLVVNAGPPRRVVVIAVQLLVLIIVMIVA